MLKIVTRRIGRNLKLAMNKNKGRVGEIAFVLNKTIQGKKVKRTGKGSDYKIGKTHYEIKTGSKARLSPRQKAKKKKVGNRRYKVVRQGL